MQGTLIKFYMPQTAKHDGRLLHEWLLETARQTGIPGGSAMRAIAGYGRHGRLHEEHFFELAGDLPVTVEFFAEDAALDVLLDKIADEGVSLFYIRLPGVGGITGKNT